MHGVVFFLSQPWKSEREFVSERTLHEKQAIARLVKQLGFNEGNKFFAMVSGDSHEMSFDSGLYNAYGDFPNF